MYARGLQCGCSHYIADINSYHTSDGNTLNLNLCLSVTLWIDIGSMFGECSYSNHSIQLYNKKIIKVADNFHYSVHITLFSGTSHDRNLEEQHIV